MSNSEPRIVARVSVQLQEQVRQIAVANKRSIGKQAEFILEQFVARSTPPAPESPRP